MAKQVFLNVCVDVLGNPLFSLVDVIKGTSSTPHAVRAIRR